MELKTNAYNLFKLYTLKFGLNSLSPHHLKREIKGNRETLKPYSMLVH